MRAINVWAWHQQHTREGAFQRAPVCSDASESTRRLGPAGYWVGAAGYHFAFPFSSLSDLAHKLRHETLPDYIAGDHRTLQRGEVQTLALDCHGGDGEFFPNSTDSPAVSAENLDDFGAALRDIGLMTASRPYDALVPDPPHPLLRRQRALASTIILICCNSAAGDDGTALLQQLSYRWPGRRVIGFSTTVVAPHLRTVEDPASGDACVAPFSLDSGRHGMRLAQSDEWMTEFRRTHGNDPRHLPFADATAANAKIARNGQIVEWPANEPHGRGASLGPQLNGPPRGNTARPTTGRQSVRRLV